MSNPTSIYGTPIGKGPFAPGFKTVDEGFSNLLKEAPVKDAAPKEISPTNAPLVAANQTTALLNLPLADRYERMMQENPDKYSASYRALFAAGDLG